MKKFLVSKEQDKIIVIKYIKELSDQKRHVIKIEEKQEKRSIDQNALYWIWIMYVVHVTGNDKDILHYTFREKFLPEKIDMVDGKRISTPISTTELDTTGFHYYLVQVHAEISTELSITLPFPEDENWDEFYNQYNNLYQEEIV